MRFFRSPEIACDSLLDQITCSPRTLAPRGSSPLPYRAGSAPIAGSREAAACGRSLRRLCLEGLWEVASRSLSSSPLRPNSRKTRSTQSGRVGRKGRTAVAPQRNEHWPGAFSETEALARTPKPAKTVSRKKNRQTCQSVSKTPDIPVLACIQC